MISHPTNSTQECDTLETAVQDTTWKLLRKEKKISLVQVEKGSFVKYYHLPVEWEKNPELFSARFGQPKLLPAVMHIIRDKRIKAW